jgi:hypothetical protein
MPSTHYETPPRTDDGDPPSPHWPLPMVNAMAPHLDHQTCVFGRPLPHLLASHQHHPYDVSLLSTWYHIGPWRADSSTISTSRPRGPTYSKHKNQR